MRSFRNRLLVLIVGLVVLSQIVTSIAVLARTQRNVELRGAEQLRAGSSFVQQFIRFRASQLASGVAVLAADFGFREAVASGDSPTILSAAKNHSQRIGADLLLLMDTRGQLLASTVPGKLHPGASFKWMLEEDDSARGESRFTVLDGRAYQIFLAPVRAPDTIAWVMMGFAVDDALAQRIRELAGTQVSLIAQGRDGIAHVASTLPAAERARLRTFNVVAPSDAAPRIVRVGSIDYLSFTQRLNAGGDSIDVLLQQPMQAVLAPYRDVREALLAIGGVTLLFAVAVGVRLGRSASRPIGELVRAAQRIQAGRYDTAVAGGGGDEFRSLADTFNAMQREIAEREARITHQVYHDALTGLPNRAYVERSLKELLQQTHPTESVALIVIELRNVRELNASLGHHVGDEALRETGRRLRQNSAARDLVARLEANQFLVLVQDCSLRRAPLLAEQLAGVIRAGFHLPAMSLDLRVSIGVCLYPEHGNEADELLRRAQIALEDAEEARSRIATYQLGRDEEHRRRLALITDLRGAIEQNGLALVYQPKVAMATRSVRSLEALVRWNHPQLGAVSPAEFVPLAERMGMSRRLTSWVTNAAISQMARWRRDGLEMEVAVNLSAPDILDPDLGDEILTALRVHGIQPTSLLLEITESAVMRDAPLAARHMRMLQIAGVRFSIDDFGTGYSSLSHLSRLPVDELKIDRSFISQAHLRSEDVAIVTSTIELGHSMGLKIVAEGVEQPEGWNLLRRLGCDYAQGYFISPPLAPGDVTNFVGQANQLLSSSDSTQQQLRVLEHLSTMARR